MKFSCKFILSKSVFPTDDELRLLELYRRADDRVKEYIFEMVRMSATKLKGKDS